MRKKNYEKNCKKIGISIEGQLKSYTECMEKTERHDILWHAWKHNKHWLCQVQEWIMPSFPSYSRHGESHALSVLNNIEMILGEDKIKKLSASDCFLILNVVYIHDIGMCITYEEKRDLVEDDKFVEYLEKCCEKGNNSMQKYANILLSSYKNISGKEVKELLKRELDVYYALTYILSEYKRKEHGEKSKELLNEWILKPDKLGSGFSTIGIPSRLFYTIAACAGVHTSLEFQDVMDLPMEDSGYARDFMHPRFAAVLLQLGDALDLDNDRFHPLIKDFMGNIPEMSEIHLGKHQSIRRLRISPDKITIHANCDTAEILRLVTQECDGIKNILRNATFYWSVICPKGLEAHLPTFEKTKLLLRGREIDEKIIRAKFNIQQDKAFNLLQGKNFYKNEFDFLKEIFQNAVDASKIQYYKQWKEGAWRNIEDFWEFAKKVSPMSYPIKIEISISKRKRYERQAKPINETSEEMPDEGEYEYGVLVKIKDYATGISSEDILAIANVGTSYERHRKLVERMPVWMSPTAEFGIGLQSVFLVTNFFHATSHTREGESYNIEFEATGEMGSGYINVTPINFDPQKDSYGTEFEIFVSKDYKIKHLKQPESWSGLDPYVPEYERTRVFRHSRELMLQMALYLNDKIGEKLFPVELSLYDFENDERIYKKLKQNNFNMDVTINFGETKEKLWDESEQDKRKVAWNYNIGVETPGRYIRWSSVREGCRCQYMFDTNEVKLYVWDQKNGIYARMGADRLFNNYNVFHDNEKYSDKGTRVYYKGVFVKEMDFRCNMCLLESIDIKSKLERKYIAINRSDFTIEGEKYIKKKLYIHLKRVLNEILFPSENGIEKEIISQVIDNVYRNLETTVREEKQNNEIQNEIHKKILASIAFTLFTSIEYSGSELVRGRDLKQGGWDNFLYKISELIEGNKKNKKGVHWFESTLYNIKVYERRIEEDMKENIANIANSSNKYAIISYRNKYGGEWREWLYRIEKQRDGDENEILGSIMQLKEEKDWKERKILIEEIEKWRDNIFEKLKNIVENNRDERIMATHWILNWILKNIPSIAIFTSSDRKMRINVIDAVYTDSVYFDANTLYQMCEEMLCIYKKTGIERFCTISMAGYHQLALAEEPLSVCFVKKGRFAYEGCKKVVFPLNGKELKNIFEQVKKCLDIPLEVQNAAKDFGKFREYILKKQKEQVLLNDPTEETLSEDLKREQEFFGKKVDMQETAEEFNRMLEEYQKNKDDSETLSKEELQGNEMEKYQKLCLGAFLKYQNNPEWDKLDEEEKKVIQYFCICREKIIKEIGRDIKKISEDLIKELKDNYVKKNNYSQSGSQIKDVGGKIDNIEENNQNKKNYERTVQEKPLLFIQYLKKELLLKDLSEEKIRFLYECMLEEVWRGIIEHTFKKREQFNKKLEKHGFLKLS